MCDFAMMTSSFPEGLGLFPECIGRRLGQALRGLSAAVILWFRELMPINTDIDLFER